MLAFNFQPTDIRVYREFPVKAGEITVFFDNTGEEPVFIYRRAVIRDGSLIPVAEAELEKTGSAEENSFFTLAPGEKLQADLLIDAANMQKLAANEEYNAVIQFSSNADFAWTDKLLDNIDTFASWNEASGAALLDEIAAMLPVAFKYLPFHVRELLDDDHLTLCMDFGTSFSACALSIDPNKSHTLACFKKTDKPRAIHYTQFPGGGSGRNIVPSALALREIISDEEADWLCGYDAMDWARRHPEKGHFITDIKDRLLSLDGKERCFDQAGRAREFSNEEIATAYLRFLTETSRRYFGVNFKNIHITLPVGAPERQRAAYERILRKLGFTRIENKLDEARAPLYHFLAENVEKFWNGQPVESRKEMEEGKALSYLIIDCGGGSTDATLLRGIKLLEPKRPGGGVELRTDEPQRGGNDTFGGTDLTDLLFNYIKMRVCEAVFPEAFQELDPALEEKKDYLIDKIIPQMKDNIFWELYRIGDPGKDAGARSAEQIPVAQQELAYGRFERLAAMLEAVFPTNEKESSGLDRNAWEKVHRNRSTVWQLAEQLKINIFADDAPKTLNLLDMPDAPDAVFYMRDNGDVPLRAVQAAEYKQQLDFHTYELDKLFRPVIFKEISRIHRNLKIQEDLSGSASFFNVRFVGQTTNIPIFNEAMAFFVPRAMIEQEDRTYKDTNLSRFQRIPAEEKKICCVTGAANFLSHISTGCLKNASQVAKARVLKNFCRFNRSMQPIAAGVYNWERKTGDGFLIKQNDPMEQAYGAVIRDLADDMTENFGAKYDEITRLEGSLNFRKEDMSRALTDEERQAAEERWGELFHTLGADPDDPAVLIQVEQFDEGSSPRYEFRPYYYDAAGQCYMTTPAPLKLDTTGTD